ncbi:hypothetical protein [Streptomyces smaragdinus]|nr:hypothetical protein [Streptomyces smaragdinus]
MAEPGSLVVPKCRHHQRDVAVLALDEMSNHRSNHPSYLAQYRVT